MGLCAQACTFAISRSIYSFISEDECSLYHAHMPRFLWISAMGLFQLLLASRNPSNKISFIYPFPAHGFVKLKVGATSVKVGQNLA